MDNILGYIVEQLTIKNPLNSKKIKKNLNRFDEAYYNRANVFLKKYVGLLKNDNKTLDYAIDCYLRMLADVNYETMQFAQTGAYTSQSFEEVNQRVYNNPEVMEYYMHGLLLSQFLWTHHYEILLWFNNVMQCNKNGIQNYLEVGGGHGLYLSEAIGIIGEKTKYDVVDISESSLRIAQKMVDNGRVTYLHANIFEYHPAYTYNVITMGEVLEHVEEPVKLLKKLYSLLSDDGKLIITAPTNAPAIDHIYLFKNADDVRKTIADAGFKIADEVCVYSEDVSPEVAEKFKVSMMYGGVLVKRRARL